MRSEHGREPTPDGDMPREPYGTVGVREPREPRTCRVAGCGNDTRIMGYVYGACRPCARRAIQDADEEARRRRGCGGKAHVWEYFEDRVRCAACDAYASPATLALLDAQAVEDHRRRHAAETDAATDRGDKWAAGFTLAADAERDALSLGYRRGWIDRARWIDR